MKILIIDNYDSFTYNLYQLIGETLQGMSESGLLKVVRNDEINYKQIKESAFDKIVLSPGPGDPSDRAYFGVCADVLCKPLQKTSVLGVCLGMQGMAHYFGGKVVRAKLPMHGKISKIQHDNSGLFADLPQDIEVMRYHSLVADKSQLPAELVITATTADENQEVMGLRHKVLPIEGIQFHPESLFTEGGKEMVKNFLESTL